MNTIEETIKMAGLGKRKAMAKQIKMYEDRFATEGETLHGACASKDERIQLYVTDKKVLLHEIKGIFKNAEKSIPLKNISSVDVVKSIVYSTITLTSTGNQAVIPDVAFPIADEIKRIIDRLKDESDNVKPQIATSSDSTDDLRKYKSLLDDGIISQEEFDAKKKQLLGI